MGIFSKMSCQVKTNFFKGVLLFGYRIWNFIILRLYTLDQLMRPSQEFGEQGKRVFISEEQGNKGQIVRGTGEQRQYWGTGNIRKQIFDFGGTGEQANLFQGNKGTGTPPPLGGPHLLSDFNYCRFKDALIIIMTIGLYYFSLEQVNVLLQLEAIYDRYQLPGLVNIFVYNDSHLSLNRQ